MFRANGFHARGRDGSGIPGNTGLGHGHGAPHPIPLAPYPVFQPAIHPERHPSHRVLPRLDGRIHQGRLGIVLAVGYRPPVLADTELPLPLAAENGRHPVGPLGRLQLRNPSQRNRGEIDYLLGHTHIFTPPLVAAKVMASASASSGERGILSLLCKRIRPSLSRENVRLET